MACNCGNKKPSGGNGIKIVKTPPSNGGNSFGRNSQKATRRIIRRATR